MKRAFILLLLSLLLPFFFASPIHAQASDSWVDTGYAESMKAAAEGDVNAAAHISNVNTNTQLDFVRRTLGPIEGVTISSADMNTPYADQMKRQSVVAGLSKYVYAMYTAPPASTYAFFNDMGQTLGFIPKQVYAQGIGFAGLSSLLPIWKAFRNISYSILAIIMIAIGFMVMFRKKIDPKTVVTVQNALPKIVITLILITFSYAIVGLMIDLMYVVMFLVSSLIINAVNDTSIFPTDTLNRVLSSDFSIVRNALWGGFNSYKALLDFLFDGALNSTEFLSQILGGLGYGVTGALLWLIFSIAFMFMSVRVFFMLLSAYIQIIIAVLTAPIQFLLEAVPGGHGFADWLKNLFCQLIVFPITAVMLLISKYLVHTSSTTWTPPLLGTGSVGVSGVIGLGLLFVTPSVVKGIQESLKAKPMVNAGLGAAAGPLGAGAGQAMQIIYQGAMIKEGLFSRKPNTNTVDSSIEAGKTAQKL